MDYAAATPLDADVERAMRSYYARVFGNPSSSHLHGQTASRAVFLARQKIAGALNADYTEIIFTGSATEANNLGVQGVFNYVFRNQNIFAPVPILPLQNRGSTIPEGIGTAQRDSLSAPPRCSLEHISKAPLRVIISAIEHDSVYEAAMALKRLYGAEIVEVPVNGEGIVDLEKLEAALNESTVLVSVQMANSEIGVIQPIREIAAITKNYKLKTKNSAYPLFHTDAVQAFQYMQCDTQKLGVDLLTLSAHKIYGPKGIGMLYIRNSKHEALNPKQIQNSNVQNVSDFGFRISDFLSPLVTGGGQENGMRSGTENVPAIVGFARAVEITEKMRAKESKRVAVLRDELWKGIKKILPDAALNGPSLVTPSQGVNRRILNIISIYLPGRPAQDVCIELDLMGVAVSPGTACASRAVEPSRVIKALNKGGDRATSSIRLSLGRQTTKGEIRSVLSILKKRFGT